MLGQLITSKTRLRLLIKFFISQANRGHLNGLASEMGESTNSIRRELNHLQGAGYLNKVKVNNKIEYKANTKHPLYDVLRKVVLKHLGLEDLVGDDLLVHLGGDGVVDGHGGGHLVPAGALDLNLADTLKHG